MAKDIKVLIGGNTQDAEAALRGLQRTGSKVANDLAVDFKQLGVQSSLSFDNKRKAATSAYERIKASGLATQDELARAEKGLADKLVSIDTDQFGKREGLLQKFKANWLAATAAMGAAYIAVTQAWAAAEQGGRVSQQREAFGNLAASHGASADKILADLKRVSAGTVSMGVLIEKAGTSMLLGIESKTLPKLMEIAKASTRITGKSTAQAFTDISLAVGRQSKMILDNLGILISVEQANKQYAASMHIVGRELTDAERKQAFINATLIEGQKIIDGVGTKTEDLADKMAVMGARMSNLKDLASQGLATAFVAVSDNLDVVVVGLVAMTAASILSGASTLVSTMVALAAAAKNFALATAAGQAGLVGMVGAGSYLAAKGAVAYLDKKLYEEFDLNLTGEAFFNAMEARNQEAQKGLDAVLAKKAAKEQAALAEQQKISDALKKQKEDEALAIKNTAASVLKYSRTLSDLGKEQLKIAKTGFSSDLARQEEFFKKTGAAAANLTAPLRNYMTVLDQVYDAQIKAQKDIATTLEAIGADQSSQMQQQINVATTEKVAAESRLQGWKDYYDKLKAMHTSALEDMKKKQDELLAVKQFGADTQKALAEKFTPPAAALDPVDKYYSDWERIDAEQARAMEATGQRRVQLLQATMNKLRELPKEVKVGDQVVISSLQIYDDAQTAFGNMQKAAEAAKQAELDTAQNSATKLKEEMDLAKTAMDALQQLVLELDGRILALNKTVSLTLSDQASGPIAQVQRALDALKDKTITVTTKYVSSVPGSFSPRIPVDTGTNYVMKTGLYQLHRGEAVKTRGEVQSEQGGSLTFAPNVTVNVSGSNQTNTMVGEEVSRQLYKRFKQYERRTMHG
jgi:hypothetical protein